MDEVVRTKGPLFVGYTDNLALVCVEGHLPLLFPLLEFIQVFLKLTTVGVVLYPPIYNRLSSAKSLISDLTHSGMSLI